MQLAHTTWQDVETRIAKGCAIYLPVGSTEQHGPMGYIGTDTICAETVAHRAAEMTNTLVAPALAYTPAPFNTAFPGTVSVSPQTFSALAGEVCQGLLQQGFAGIFVLNGHGANLAPLRAIQETLPPNTLHIRSWWDPAEVQAYRQEHFGEWEGMHATPSEVAITQALLGALPEGQASTPPRKLSPDYIKAHAGDRHGPPDQHRAEFPDGRVGSHSALATPEHGRALLGLATTAISAEFAAYEKALT